MQEFLIGIWHVICFLFSTFFMIVRFIFDHPLLSIFAKFGIVIIILKGILARLK